MASENESLKVGDEVICHYDIISGWHGTIIRLSNDNATIKWNDRTVTPMMVPNNSLTRILPAQAEPVKTNPNWPAGAVADITAALDRKVEPVKEWVPVAGEKVLVEAELIGMSSDNSWAKLIIQEHRYYISVRLSQLRPLPVTQEEGVS